MCGIAGLVYQQDAQAAEQDWAGLAQAMRAVLEHPLDLHQPGPIGQRIETLEARCASLREYPVLRQLLHRPEVQAELDALAVSLAQWDLDVQRAATAPEANVNTHLIEDWNSLGVRLRDLIWTIQRDTLACLRRIRDMVPEGYDQNEKACFEAWKLTTTLENIGRLEVRGRDSLGLSVMVTFPNRQELADWEQWIQEHADTECAARRDGCDLLDRAVVSDGSAAEPSYVFVYKVAQEVGALGDNVAAICKTVHEDSLLWKAVSNASTRTNLFTHTRWASNGIISEPNCHPVSELTITRNGKPNNLLVSSSPHRIMACLNGDVDNYQELCSRWTAQTGRVIPTRISTDTKIIPVMCDYHYQQFGDMRQAFCKTVSDCEGSIAIVMHSTLEPNKTYLALRGSGQALFVGLCERGYVFASELYGVVEQTQTFVRMDGTRERVPGRPETAGQVLVLDSTKSGLEGIEVWSFDGERFEEGGLKAQKAEITTRDINRGDFTHFLLKEISEAPESVRKTIRGKFFLNRQGEDYSVRMNLDDQVLPHTAIERLKSGEIRRVFLIGQGTAAVAGQAVASIMQQSLGQRVSVKAIKATELSGYSMEKEMNDALVIAISQSGTTTDTNRTVDMVKSRGAVVVGIVNRRNSDLVYKVDGVLYTSDGRDIEMSVASTKAFYSQVVAGYLLTYQLALALGTVSETDIYHELQELIRLPELMRSVLANQQPIASLAEHWAPTRRDWAIVGSGPTRAAADEIRIKLSELCYKSIATDYIEDKKHIDLSSEPLTLICTAGLPLMALKDAVKEVAIFKAHKSVPIVICSEGFPGFEPYAAGVLYVPKSSEASSVLLNTLVGHLWGYYCALAIDKGAEQLRHARALAVKYLTSDTTLALSPSLMRSVREIGNRFRDDLIKGRLNSSLSVEVGSQLSNLFQYFTGANSLRQFSVEFQTRATPADVSDVLVSTLSQAIHELSRPIDAIKHQAKTVTVGISRLEELYEGPVFEALQELEVAPDSVPYRDLVDLKAITPAVTRVRGITCYNVSGLGTLGEVLQSTMINVNVKLGEAAGMKSRADKGMGLVGTKEMAVRRSSTYIGRGRKDQKPIIIIPSAPRGQVDKLVLLHVEFNEALPLEARVTVLRDLGGRYDDLRSQVLETDTEWNDDVLTRVSMTDLITQPVDKLTEQLLAELQKTVTRA